MIFFSFQNSGFKYLQNSDRNHQISVEIMISVSEARKNGVSETVVLVFSVQQSGFGYIKHISVFKRAVSDITAPDILSNRLCVCVLLLSLSG